MKFVTRAHARVDRIACAWLVHRFIDPAADVLYVPAADVMRVAELENAIPFDVPDVELGHHGELCSFDAFLDKYSLDDPALRSMAVIIRGADTDAFDLTPESAGLHAIATGFHALQPSRFIKITRCCARNHPCTTRCTSTVRAGETIPSYRR
jgi:hypothetical protein